MITLVTGLPGHGKTLYTLCYIKALAERESRPVFYSGIADLRLPWAELGDLARQAEEFVDGDGLVAYRFKLPPKAIVVVDEAQRVFRPRGLSGKVPPQVAALETHRHDGVDLFLITQHPMLMDTNVRRLVGRHFHVVRPFGLQRATVHEWSELRENVQSRADSVRHEFAYPRQAFRWYKSAEVHTVRRSIPMRVWFLVGLPLLVLALAWSVGAWWRSKSSAPALQGQPVAASSGKGALVSRAKSVPTVVEYVDARRARIEDLPESAPVYDEIAKPVVFPTVAACVQSARVGCVCYTQQGTRLASISKERCTSFVRYGAFDPYHASEQPGRVAEAPRRAEATVPGERRPPLPHQPASEQ